MGLGKEPHVHYAHAPLVRILYVFGFQKRCPLSHSSPFQSVQEEKMLGHVNKSDK